MPDYNKLVKQAIKGDYDAFEQLVEQHKDKVYSTCLLLLGSIPEGLEAAEQVFVTVYRSLREAEGKSVSEWIYRQAETHASTLRRELDGRGYSQPKIEAVTLKTADEIKAPPGFTQAIRERLRLDAEVVQKCASRRASRKIALGVAATSASLLAVWAGWQYFAPGPEHSRTILQASSLPAPTPPAASPAAPQAPPLPQAPPPTQREQKPVVTPEIVITRPRHDNATPESIFRSVSPPLKSQPVRDGNTWTVELTDDQFWSMHTLLKAAYIKVRIPESAIPRDQSRARIRLKFVSTVPPQHKAEPAREQANIGIETGGRLPAEDLLKQ